MFFWVKTGQAPAERTGYWTKTCFNAYSGGINPTTGAVLASIIPHDAPTVEICPVEILAAVVCIRRRVLDWPTIPPAARVPTSRKQVVKCFRWLFVATRGIIRPKGCSVGRTVAAGPPACTRMPAHTTGGGKQTSDSGSTTGGRPGFDPGIKFFKE